MAHSPWQHEIHASVLLAGLHAGFHGIAARWREQARRRRDEQHLRALPDHALRDLAMGRSDIAGCIVHGRDIDTLGCRVAPPESD